MGGEEKIGGGEGKVWEGGGGNGGRVSRVSEGYTPCIPAVS